MRMRKSSLVLGIFALLTSCLPVNMTETTSSKIIDNSYTVHPKANPYYGEIDLKIDNWKKNIIFYFV